MSKVQIKFTIDAALADAFKARCASEGLSMTSVISQLIMACRPLKTAKPKMDTRGERKRAVLDTIAFLSRIMQREEEYRDVIPEQFQGRYETADQTCEQLSQAISCLEEAY